MPPLDALIDLGRAFAEGAKAKSDVIRVWLDRSTGVGLNSWPNYLQALDHFQRAAEEILMEGKRQWIVPECPNIKAAAGTCLEQIPITSHRTRRRRSSWRTRLG